MSLYTSLVKSIDFATETLDSFRTEKELEENSVIVLSSLFRKIIELSEGVRVSAENGLRGPAELSYRSLLETHLAFKYITVDNNHIENRAKAYKINYHKLQIQSIKEAAYNEDLLSANKEWYEKTLKVHLDEMEKEELENVLGEYDRMHYHDRRNNRRQYVPKWHALYGGPTSINKLAEEIGQQMNRGNRTAELLPMLYGFLSQGAHSYLDLRGITRFNDGRLGLKNIRERAELDTSDHFKDTFSLMPVRFLLEDTLQTFVATIYPEYEEQLKHFLNE